MVHDRMPLILQPGSIGDWLDPKQQDAAQLRRILEAGRVETLRCYPVSQHVNAVSHNDPACASPLHDTDMPWRPIS